MKHITVPISIEHISKSLFNQFSNLNYKMKTPDPIKMANLTLNKIGFNRYTYQSHGLIDFRNFLFVRFPPTFLELLALLFGQTRSPLVRNVFGQIAQVALVVLGEDRTVEHLKTNKCM